MAPDAADRLRKVLALGADTQHDGEARSACRQALRLLDASNKPAADPSMRIMQNHAQAFNDVLAGGQRELVARLRAENAALRALLAEAARREERGTVRKPKPRAYDVRCPECGSPMVRRDGRRGEFWGCSDYPECRGTRDLGDEG